MNKFGKKIKGFFGFINKYQVIQIGVFISIALTCILTLISINQQGYFNKLSSRPWVFIRTDNKIVIEEESFRINYTLINVGKTPAYYMFQTTFFSFDKEFPIKSNIQFERAKQADTLMRSILPPGAEITAISRKFALNGSSDILLFPSTKYRIKESESYIHFYIRYEDNAKNQYFLRTTTLLRYIKDWEKGYICDFKTIFMSEEKL